MPGKSVEQIVACCLCSVGLRAETTKAKGLAWCVIAWRGVGASGSQPIGKAENVSLSLINWSENTHYFVSNTYLGARS